MVDTVLPSCGIYLVVFYFHFWEVISPYIGIQLKRDLRTS